MVKPQEIIVPCYIRFLIDDLSLIYSIQLIEQWI